MVQYLLLDKRELAKLTRFKVKEAIVLTGKCSVANLICRVFKARVSWNSLTWQLTTHGSFIDAIVIFNVLISRCVTKNNCSVILGNLKSTNRTCEKQPTASSQKKSLLKFLLWSGHFNLSFFFNTLMTEKTCFTLIFILSWAVLKFKIIFKRWKYPNGVQVHVFFQNCHRLMRDNSHEILGSL